MTTHESLEFDIVIVGAGPSGLCCAIRLAQLCKQDKSPLSICVIEKGASVGAHILSGAILEPRALNELLPDWKQMNPPIDVTVAEEKLLFLTAKHALRLPTPPQLQNEGNYVISLGNLCCWLASYAESLGVALFPSFAGVKLLYDASGKVYGVRTGDKGLNKKGEPTDIYQPGINLLAKQTLLAEGCHGSLTKMLIKKFDLRRDSSPQTYGMGVKELWEIPEKLHRAGTTIHTMGWPLNHRTYGGGFLYHGKPNQVSVGLVVGLDYSNTYLDPFKEMQRFKTHPSIRKIFEEGRRICYGARALCEGGWQSIPKLTVPGAMIIGDSAGFLNVPKIKGIHNSMKSGMIAAEVIYQSKDKLDVELKEYEAQLKKSWVGEELYQARNIRPAFRKGLWMGLAYSILDTYLLRGKAPWTFKNYPDYSTLKPALPWQRIDYPKPDNKITFDKLSSLDLANLNYREDQPCHLQILNDTIPVNINLDRYDGPETRYCPANVYEFIHVETSPQLVINAGNCVQCKTCDIKDPLQNINWVPPEGGDGPNYSEM